MADYGIRISNSGIDAFSGLIDDMTFSSATFLFKSIATGTYTFNAPGGTAGLVTSSSVLHGLGYRPFVFAYWSVDNLTWRACGYRYSGGTFVNPDASAWSGNGFQVELGASSTAITTSFRDSVGAGATVYIRYIIYVDSMS